ncbi:MAG: hypothetical protein JRI36_02055 [Deltaproteobacteria bacterium]|nr:hypothetical protein [Deltaproteobacteria bacterium]
MKTPVKEKCILTWHALELKHATLCEKLSLYLEAQKKAGPTSKRTFTMAQRPGCGT